MEVRDGDTGLRPASVILAESRRETIRRWSRGLPMYPFVAIVYGVVTHLLGALSLPMGLLTGALFCGMPLLTRRAVVFTKLGLVRSLLPSFWTSPARLQRKGLMPIPYSDINTLTVHDDGADLILCVTTRSGDDIRLRCDYCNTTGETAREMLRRWST